MLLTGSQLINTPVMSLQTGKELARAATAIINPHNLSVVAYKLEGQHLDHQPSYLRISDMRELGTLGMIVDSSDEFVEPDDIITDKHIYELEYTLEGKHVIDENKKTVGKVIDYVVDVESFVIQQLTVRRPLLKSFTHDELLVHRSQIVEVNDSAIIIKSSMSRVKAVAASGKQLVNPFRQAPQPGPVHIETKD